MSTSEMNLKIIRDIAQIMQELTGIFLQDKQYSMMESRLTKRIYELGLSDFEQYMKHLKGNFSTESKVLITLLTTHHTSFFREFVHFEFLLREALPKMIEQLRAQKKNKIRIWSAACSTGQEIYSLAMFLDYHLPQLAPDFDYEIFGTDIDIGCIKSAKNGVYRYELIKEIPSIYQGKHWQKGTGDIASYVRISEKIRKRCQFMTNNLFDTSMLFGQSYHFIFCRNVFIYFNQDQVESVAKSLLQLLAPNGYLLLGLSESLSGNTPGVDQVGPSVYFKPDASVSVEKVKSVSLPEPQVQYGGAAAVYDDSAPRLKRVVCVDDSTVILSILKKILNADNGFEVVGTAANGMAAREVIEKEKPDIVTMDIHMPLMTGVDYLKNYMTPDHPPVVMVSSVSREEAEYGVQSLEYGAIDFIEKPSLVNLQEKTTEICLKLKSAIEFKKSSENVLSLDLVRSFQTNLDATANANLVRLCVGGIGDLHKIKAMLSSLQDQFPPFVILIHGGESFISMFVSQFKSFHKKIHNINDHEQLQKNHVYIAAFEQLALVQSKTNLGADRHVFLVGENSENIVVRVLQVENSYIFLEERSSFMDTPSGQLIKEKANEIVPYTSMLYHSSRLVASKAVA